MNPRLFYLLVFVAANVALAAPGPQTEFSGYVGGDVRSFSSDPRWPGQQHTIQRSLLLQPEYRRESSSGRDLLTFVGFMRKDFDDQRRSHFDIREANWLHTRHEYDIRVGVGKVFWGVTEARHLVNIVNQIDLREDVVEEDYLGQPFINIETQRDWGLLSAFVMPVFREREHADTESRLRSPVPIDDGASRVDDSGADIALRWSHYFAGWDLGLSYFNGTSREPVFELDPDTGALVPMYEKINQAGADIQFTKDAWLLKLEAIVREGQGDTFGAAVAGFEYTFFQVADSDIDVGVLLEYLKDNRSGDAPPTPFENDLFFGGRFSFNNVQDSSLLAGGYVDFDDGTTSLRVEAETRLGESWRLELNLQVFTNTDKENLLDSFSKDDFLDFRLLWYF